MPPCQTFPLQIDIIGTYFKRSMLHLFSRVGDGSGIWKGIIFYFEVRSKTKVDTNNNIRNRGIDDEIS